MVKERSNTLNSMNSQASNTALKPRPKMKTTTMIINDSSLPANHSQELLHHRSMFPAQIGKPLLIIDN